MHLQTLKKYPAPHSQSVQTCVCMAPELSPLNNIDETQYVGDSNHQNAVLLWGTIILSTKPRKTLN